MESLVSFGDCYRNKKVLITGETGFKGAWLALWLTQLGAKVYACSKDIPTTPSLFETIQLNSVIDHRMSDIRNADLVRNFTLEIQPDFIFHLAAQAIVKTAYLDPLDTFTSNIMGTANMLEAAKSLTSPCQFICITSDKCYENVEWLWGYRENDRLGGKDPYSASKGCSELIFSSYFHSFFQNHPVQVCSTRAGNVIGGGDWAADRIVPDSFRSWGKKEAVHLRNPQATRPWQHVLEPLSGYLRLGQLMATRILTGESYNFGPLQDQNFTVEALVSSLQSYWKTPFDSMVIVESSPTFKEANLLKLNCEKAATYLDWQATLSFEEMSQMTTSWYEHYFCTPESVLEFTQDQLSIYTHIANRKQLSWVSPR